MTLGTYHKRQAIRILMAEGWTKREAKGMLLYAKMTHESFSYRDINITYGYNVLSGLFESYDTWTIRT